MSDERPMRLPFPAPVALNSDPEQVLASVDSLQLAWAEVIRSTPPDEFRAARHRSLRRHAIETGVIERLYDVDWGVTEALVAEGLSAEVAEREGGLDERALETIRAQFEALNYVSEAADDGEELTVTFLRRLHILICGTQPSFAAVDQLGRTVVKPLRHGEWKELSNHAVTRSGDQFTFAPPEQVQSEIERMLALEVESRHLHPVIRAAWIHYALVSIHPFDDGNGRVARALALLVLLRAHYGPLVVDRFSRDEYLVSLEAANRGDLRALVRLFARLEMVALRSELERPAVAAGALDGAGAVDVARAYVDRLRSLRGGLGTDRAAAAELLAAATNDQVEQLLQRVGAGLAEQFQLLDGQLAFEVLRAQPPEERAAWWRAQIVRAAKRGGFFTDLTGGAWWSYLRLTVLGQQLRYVVVTQKVGRGDTGVLAVTVFAESVPTAIASEPGAPAFTPLLAAGQDDSVTLVHTDDLAIRWQEIADLVDRTLAVAVANFAEGLG